MGQRRERRMGYDIKRQEGLIAVPCFAVRICVSASKIASRAAALRVGKTSELHLLERLASQTRDSAMLAI